MFNWFFKKGSRQGIFWAVTIYLTCAINDVFSRLLGSRLHFVEISFFRFLFSVFIVLILIGLSQKNLFRSKIHKWHLYRGTLGAVALMLCCLSVNIMPFAENAVILFSESLFMLPLTAIFLSEKTSVKCICATTIGFLGLIVMYRPSAANINLTAIIPTVSAILFAIMNIMMKKMVDKKENDLTMLFYFALYATILSGAFVPFFWTTPNISELLLLSLLAISANAIQLFAFLAYRATSASKVSQVRYIELPFAILFGFLFFSEVPDTVAIFGATLIIIGTFIASYFDKTDNRLQN